MPVDDGPQCSKECRLLLLQSNSALILIPHRVAASRVLIRWCHQGPLSQQVGATLEQSRLASSGLRMSLVGVLAMQYVIDVQIFYSCFPWQPRIVRRQGPRPGREGGRELDGVRGTMSCFARSWAASSVIAGEMACTLKPGAFNSAARYRWPRVTFSRPSGSGASGSTRMPIESGSKSIHSS